MAFAIHTIYLAVCVGQGCRHGLAVSSAQSYKAVSWTAFSSEALVGKDLLLTPSDCWHNPLSCGYRTEDPVFLPTVALGYSKLLRVPCHICFVMVPITVGQFTSELVEECLTFVC